MMSNGFSGDFSSYSVSPMPANRFSTNTCSFTDSKLDLQSYSPYGQAGGGNNGFCPNRAQNINLYNQPSNMNYSPNQLGMSSCMYAASISPSMSDTASPDNFNYSPAPNCTKENDDVRYPPNCRRRLDFNHNSFVDVTKVGPVAVAKRNERERNRVKLINMTFHSLRQHLPLQKGGSKGKARKLSKVQTLRSAIDYIRQLQDLVQAKSKKMTNADLNDQTGFTTECLLDLDSGLTNNNFVTVKSEAQSPINNNFHEPGTCQTNGLQPMPTVHREDSMTTESSGSPDMSMGVSIVNAYIMESPVSEASSYDVVTTPENERDEFVDFDDWF